MDVIAGPPLDGPHETLVQTLWRNAKDGLGGGYAIRKGEAMDLHEWPRVQKTAKTWAAGLIAKGVKPGDRVAILAETRREWKVADHAIHAAGAVVVPIYPTLAKDQVAYILKDCGAKHLFVDKALLKLVPAKWSGSTWQFEGTGAKSAAALAKTGTKTSAATVEKRVAGGKLDDIGLLIYTSGTTGVPKGVVLTHRNLAGDVGGAVQALELDMIKGASLVAFLPLAHIAGYVSLAALTAVEGTVLFSRPDKMASDLHWMRPTVALAVPRLWERIVRKVHDTVDQAPALRRKIFAAAEKTAVEIGAAKEDAGKVRGGLAFRQAIFEKLVYKKLREKLGFDRLIAGITGAAAVRPDLLRFLQGIGLPVVEGYGMTESSALTTATRYELWRAGTVGTPLPGSKIALDDDGEILIGGVGVFQQYWNQPEETASTRVIIDGEPWVRSGDIGKLDDAGNLMIIDRKKELEVLDTGKMIAPVRVEEMLKGETPFVEDSILVANGQKFAAMLIQPAYDTLLAWAEKAGIEVKEGELIRQQAPTGEIQTYGAGPSLLANPRIKKLFEDAIKSLNDKVSDYERVRKFELIPHAFTIDRGELTPSFKKKRKAILANYKEKVAAFFA